jgi:hypothetical protein
MKSDLLRRLEVLEARMAPVVAAIFFRYGWLRGLPKDFTGERHVVPPAHARRLSLNEEFARPK